MRRNDLIFIGLCFLGVAAYYALLINNYSSDLFILDAWHPVHLALHSNITDSFISFNGPHPLGLTSVLYSLDPYNASNHAWLQFLILCVTALLAIFLKFKLSNELRYYDAGIPILFFSLNSLESTLSSPYIHGLAGIFVLSLVILYLSPLDSIAKYLALTIISFFCIFSIYFYIPLIFYSLLLIFNWNSIKIKGLYLANGLLSLVSVFLIVSEIDNTSSSLLAQFNAQLFIKYLHEYLLSFWNLDSSQRSIFLSFLFLSSLVFCLPLIGRVKKSSNKLMLSFLFLSFFAFAILQALGRHTLNLANAHASRYYYFIPVFLFTIYLIFQFRLRLPKITGFFFLIASLLIYSKSQSAISWAENGYEKKKSIVECLKNSNNLLDCQETVNYIVHPHPLRDGVVELLQDFKETKKGVFE